VSKERGTLEPEEFHPAAKDALRYMQGFSLAQLMVFMESFSSVALSGNRPAEICAETLRRLLDSEPVSDRYLLGLAWTIRDMEDNDQG